MASQLAVYAFAPLAGSLVHRPLYIFRRLDLSGFDLCVAGTRNPVPACHGPGAANAYGRGGGNQTGFPNNGGTHSCSKESYRCPPKSMNDPSPSPPCKGDTSEFAWSGNYYGPQFEPVGGYPGKFAAEGVYTYG